jgi:hypothetical protein
VARVAIVVNARTGATPEAAAATGPTYSLTFGVYNQDTPWTDVRALSWHKVVELLTGHETGRKAGTCVAPAVFSGDRRGKDTARRIDVAFLDSDAGATLRDITGVVAECGWAAVVSSTHSHLSTRTRAKRAHWAKFQAAAGDGDRSAAAFLRLEKGYLPRIAEGARLVKETDELAILEHAPCPKFRIAVPLLRPWRAEDYGDQRGANAAWKEAVEALAAALRLDHDQSCTDTSRVFYLPRRPPGGPAPERAVLDGTPCDIFALPRTGRGGPHGGAATGSRAGDGGSTTFADPDTGEVFDLVAWARRSGGGFEIERALRARRPEVFVGKTADGVKHHVRCVNEDEHTQAGADAATIVVNAGESDNRGFVCHCRHAHCDGRDRLFFLRRMLERGWLTTADLDDARFRSGGGRSRPVIRYAPGQLPKIVDEAEAALLAGRPGIYQRGTFIVRPGRVMVAVSKGREAPAQRILEVGDHAMAEAMTEAADWKRFDARSKRWMPIDAPEKVAATYRERLGRWALPVLAGIIDAPTLRPDGTVLAQPGYDRATGLLLDTRGVAFPAIPERPTRSDAVRALAALDDLIATFPFVGRASRAVALSAILTACVRRSLPTAPMHAFTAPVAGTGKSMLVDVACAVATGREAGVIAQGKAEEELEKRLSALLLAGEQVIAIDNCEAPLGGEFLCAMLTQRVVRPRILGRSETPELPSNAFVTATGNNLALAGDLTRRALLCRLDAEHERPELRVFEIDPVAAVKADRGRYVAAALTVLRAYHVAGRPDRPDPLGSFEGWSDWVRGALLWAGQADPVGTMEEARGRDPKLGALAAVVEQWRAIIGDRPVSASEIIERATRQRTAVLAGRVGCPAREYSQPDFRQALLAVAGKGGAVDPQRFGLWLAANKDRVVQGHRIVRQGFSGGAMKWRLERSDGGGGDAGG